jgi:hypothetical protein
MVWFNLLLIALGAYVGLSTNAEFYEGMGCGIALVAYTNSVVILFVMPHIFIADTPM